MEINWVGELILGDMHALHGYQIQPAYAETDILYTLGPLNMLSLEGISFDRHHDCTTLEAQFIPFNQKVTGTAIRDDGVHKKAGLPAVRWESITQTGAGGAVTATLQEFPDGHWGFSYWSATVKKDSWAQDATLIAKADHIEGANGVARPMTERELVCYFSHHLFAKVQDTAASVYVKVKVAGYWYRVRIEASAPTAVDKSVDDGTTYTQVKDALKPGTSSAEVSGATGSNRLGDMVECRFRVLNSRLTISIGGSAAAPMLVTLAKDTRWGVLGVSGQQMQLPEGAVDALPPTPFDAFAWLGGTGTQQTLNPITITAKNPLTNVVTASGSLAGIGQGAVLDILDPRIDAIEFEVSGYSSFACSVHPTRWRSEGSFRRAPFQTGFMPNAATQTGFSLHTDCEVGTVRNGMPWHPSMLTSATILPQLDLSGATGTYLMTLKGVDQNGAPSGDFASYQGTDYAEDTPVLTRVTTRFAGQVETPSYSYIRIPLGVGGENPVQSITQELAFDPASLTITNRATILLDNFRGLGALSAHTGVGAFGNVGVGLRLGHAHQQFLSPDGGLGLYRFWGFSDTRGFSTPPMGGKSNMTLICTDQNQQLAECHIAAPPDLDGHNHYWAMAFLAQRAGIPLSKMAFAHLVPDDPYGASPFDPEPYFLPSGAGMHPWTPVNRTMPVIQLMEQVRKTTGFMQFFDSAGYLRYEPFTPLLAYLGGPKRIFTHIPWPGGTDWMGGLTEIRNLNISTSVRDVRNQVLLIGVDSEHSWGVIGAKLEDSASISSPAGYQPINYKGYQSPMIWMDSRFASEGFALKSAKALYNWLRQPAVTVTFECWPQYDLFPMDMIYVDDWRTGLLGVPLFILSMSQTTPSHGPGSCTITARYLDPMLLSGV